MNLPHIKILFSLICLSALSISTALCQISYNGIKRIIDKMDATIGVAVIYKDSVFTVGNSEEYPLMSVFKLHIAIAALKKMEQERISLDSMIYIEPHSMHKNTYSPLRDKYPDKRIHISYRDIIKYTVSHSDNNTCDILIDFAGGIEQVDSYIKSSTGIKDFNLSETEASMHENIAKCYNNWGTPLSVAQLLKKVYTDSILSEKHLGFLEQTMIETSSGKDKIKAGLPKNVNFGHKTGHSDRTDKGIQIGEADAGAIYMPNGEKCYIVVLIKDSKESDTDNAKIMACIARTVYHSIVK